MKAPSLQQLFERLGFYRETPKQELNTNSYDRYLFWVEKQVESLSH